MALEVIEVVEEGPQGVAIVTSVEGTASMLTSFSALTQVIPTHLATPATEKTLDFGTKVGEVISVGGGVLTINKELNGVLVEAEVHFIKLGGSPRLSTWLEFSYDNEVTWTVVPNSLRSKSVDKDGAGFLIMLISSDAIIPENTKYRIKATNRGTGSISVQPDPTFVTALGNTSGFSTKIVINSNS